jgi:hypothetical protein
MGSVPLFPPAVKSPVSDGLLWMSLEQFVKPGVKKAS